MMNTTICLKVNNSYFYSTIGLGPHLFVKVPRPGDSEMTFSVSSQAAA